MKPYILSLLAALVLQSPLSHAVSCEGLLIDARYGLFSQSDYRIGKDGNFDKGDSNLCGPACLVNAMVKIRTVLGLPQVDPVEEMDGLLTNVAAKAGLNKQKIIEGGITSGNLGKLAAAYLNDELKIPVKISNHWIGEKDVTIADLLGSAGDRKVVILAYSNYPITDPTATTFRYLARDSGHFVIIGGDPIEGMIPVYDSATGLRMLFASGEVIFSDNPGKGLWLATHPDSQTPDSRVATDVLTIELTGD